MIILLAISLIFLAVCAWVGVFFAIPVCQRSRFRYQLWQLRDQVVDQRILSGRATAPDQWEGLRTEIEQAIRYAPSVTMFRLFLFSVLAWRSAISQRPHIETVRIADAEE